MKYQHLELSFDYKRIELEASDYSEADTTLLANMVFQLFAIRKLEEAVLNLHAKKCVHGPVHISIGEEACAVGTVAALRPDDKITSSHRAHHHYLAKALAHFSDDFNPLTNDVPSTMQQEVTSLLGEIMGLSIGCCGGRGGSMHLRDAKIGVIGTNAIVAGGVPLATGAAFASQYRKDGDVIVAFLGDGGVNQGVFFESMNLAAIWNLPIVYFIENNQYAVATSIAESHTCKELAIKASAYNIPARIVDGMDPLAVMFAVEDAAEYARSGKGPVVVEAKCFRFVHHSGPLAGSALGYRSKDEEKKWKKTDPFIAFPQQLIDAKIFSDEQINTIKTKADKTVQKAIEHCTVSDGDNLIVNAQLWPKLDTVEAGIRSDGSEFDAVQFSEIEDFDEFEEKKFVEAIFQAQGRNLEKDDRVFIIGEDIANFAGGVFSGTTGLAKRFPDRVLNTPISEAGFCGLGGGAAMSGLRPIVELMYPDFALVAADQLFNQIGKLRYMYGDTTDMPIVVRTRTGTCCGYGGQHSIDPVAIFSLFSGWRVVAPSNSFDYIGLFNSAIISKDPVLMVEHNMIYNQTFDVPKDNLDYFIPLDKAKLVKAGSQATVLCYSSTVALVKEAADQLLQEGVDVEVIDLRTLSPADIDYETIGKSMMKTETLVTVEQAPKSLCIGPAVCAECQKRFFDYFDGPALNVTGLDIPNPVSKVLEEAAVPNLEQVKTAITQAANRHL